MNSLVQFVLLATLVFSDTVLTLPVMNIGKESNALESSLELPNQKNDMGVNVTAEDSNPFLRAKRQVNSTCAVPPNWPKLITDLNSFINSTTSMALFPQQPNYVAPPTDQPTTCPTQTGSWWPGKTENLRSTCPWIYKTTDLGELYYPRYVSEASCLCTTACVNSNVMGCLSLRQEITVLKKGACKDGLAAMTQVKWSVVVGCYCASPAAQAAPVAGPPSSD